MKDKKFDKELLGEIHDAEMENKYDKTVTYLKKKQFIDEINKGLGQQIKNNSNKVTIIKIPLYRKIVGFFRELLLKF